VSYYKAMIIVEKSMVGTLAYKNFKLEQWFPIHPNVALKKK